MSYDVTKLIQLGHLKQLAQKIKNKYYNKKEVDEKVSPLATRQELEDSFKVFKYPRSLVFYNEDNEPQYVAYSKNKIYPRPFDGTNYEEILFESANKYTYRLTVAEHTDRQLAINGDTVHAAGFYAGYGLCGTWGFYTCEGTDIDDQGKTIYLVTGYDTDTLPENKPVMILGQMIFNSVGYWCVLVPTLTSNRILYAVIPQKEDTEETYLDEETGSYLPVQRTIPYKEAVYRFSKGEGKIGKDLFLNNTTTYAENTVAWYFKPVSEPAVSDKYAYKWVESVAQLGEGEGAVKFGESAEASGENAIALGKGTVAAGNNQLAIGQYNEPDENKILSVGFGSEDHVKSVATIDQAGNIKTSGYVYAEQDIKNSNYSLEELGNIKDDKWWGPDKEVYEISYASGEFIMEYEFRGIDWVYGDAIVPIEFCKPGNYFIKIKDNDFSFNFTISNEQYNEFLNNDYIDLDADGWIDVKFYKIVDSDTTVKVEIGAELGENSKYIGQQYFRIEKSIYTPLVAEEIDIGKDNDILSASNGQLLLNGSPIVASSTTPYLSLRYYRKTSPKHKKPVLINRLVIEIHNTQYQEGMYIQCYQMNRRKRRSFWTKGCRGYKQMRISTNPPYPDAPDWMPNRGNPISSWEVTPEMFNNKNQYHEHFNGVEIQLSEWLLDFLKPNYGKDFSSFINFVGIGNNGLASNTGKRKKQVIRFLFVLCDSNNNILGQSINTLRIGSKNKSDEEMTLSNFNEQLYVSVQ